MSGMGASGFLIVALIVGLLCRNLLTKVLPFPYTVVLLLVGFIWGAIDLASDHAGPLGESTKTWVEMDPHTLLFLFLPTLIFESAFSLDFHIFRKSFGQILILAVPGMLLSTLLTAAIVTSSFHDTWDFQHGLMFGAILSATDPVAVVAMLKELGASKTLSTLIEGESLLNDGTAIVVFTVFFDSIAADEEANFGELVGLFLGVSLGGALVGGIFALLTIVVLSYIYNDMMSEITLTVVSCYATFMVAESMEPAVSGVLAVVTLGVLMSTYGKLRISGEVEQYLDSFWEMMGYIANTVIFVLSGAIISEKALGNDIIQGRDWGLLIALYIILHLIRLFSLLVFSPVLTRYGYSVTVKEGLVVAWAGLRGAVGLALALVVETNPRIDEQISDRIVFYVAGIAFLTLLINGSTMKWLLRYLGMDRKSLAKQQMYEHACDLIEQKVVSEAAAVKQNRFLADADWDLVWLYMPVHSAAAYKARIAAGLVDPDVSKMPSRLRRRWTRYNKAWGPQPEGAFDENPLIRAGGGGEDGDGADGGDARAAFEPGSPTSSARRAAVAVGMGAPMTTTSHTPNPARVIAEVRQRFVNVVRSKYWQRLDNGGIGESAMRLLDSAEAKQLDREDKQLSEWKDHLEAHTHLPNWHNALYACAPLRGLLNPLTVSTLTLAYDMAANFIQAHETALDHSAEWGETEAVNTVRLESAKQIDLAQRRINSLDRAFPEITRAVKTKGVVRRLLTRERHYVEELRTNGALDEGEFEGLINGNNASIKKVATHPPATSMPSTAQALHMVHLLDHLTDAAFNELIRHAETVVLESGENLCLQDDAATHMFVVSRGFVTRSRVEHDSEHGAASSASGGASAGAGAGAAPGATDAASKRAAHAAALARSVLARKDGSGFVAGASSVLLDTPMRETVTADSLVQAYRFSKDTLGTLMAAHPTLRLAMWRMAGEELGNELFPMAPSSAVSRAFDVATLAPGAGPFSPGDDTVVLLSGTVTALGGAPVEPPVSAPDIVDHTGEDIALSEGATALRVPQHAMRALDEAVARAQSLSMLHLSLSRAAGLRRGAQRMLSRARAGHPASPSNVVLRSRNAARRRVPSSSAGDLDDATAGEAEAGSGE